MPDVLRWSLFRTGWAVPFSKCGQFFVQEAAGITPPAARLFEIRFYWRKECRGFLGKLALRRRRMGVAVERLA